jgi:hypothetical protein
MSLARSRPHRTSLWRVMALARADSLEPGHHHDETGECDQAHEKQAASGEKPPGRTCDSAPTSEVCTPSSKPIGCESPAKVAKGACKPHYDQIRCPLAVRLAPSKPQRPAASPRSLHQTGLPTPAGSPDWVTQFAGRRRACVALSWQPMSGPVLRQDAGRMNGDELKRIRTYRRRSAELVRWPTRLMTGDIDSPARVARPRRARSNAVRRCAADAASHVNRHKRRVSLAD